MYCQINSIQSEFVSKHIFEKKPLQNMTWEVRYGINLCSMKQKTKKSEEA